MAIDYKPEQNDYTNLTPFKSWLVNQINSWGVNNFPFLEGDFDKLTNYGMLMKMMKCLNDIINNENLVEDDMSKLQNYINDYFDNLDVQKEINNKLDEMAQDGTLTQLIQEYIDPIYTVYENRINSTVNLQNNRITSLESNISSIASGSPAGVYLNLQTLISQNPDHTKIYLTTDNGHWNYYDVAQRQFVSGGVYQATSIGENTINFSSLDNKLKSAIGVTKPIYSLIEDYYIRQDARIIPQSGYCYTSPFQLKENQKIVFNGRGSNQNVAMLSKCDINGDNIIPLVLSIDNDTHEYSYVADKDMYVIISGRTNTITDDYIYYEEEYIINDLNKKINDNKEYSYILSNNSPVIYGESYIENMSNNIEQGYFNDGVPSSSNNRIRSINFLTLSGNEKILNLLENSSYRIFIYNTDESYSGTTDWITNKTYEYNFLDNKKYKFAFKFNDNSDITPSDLVNKFYILSGQNDLKTALQDVLDIDDTEYPAYWESTINNKVEQINSLIKEYTENNNDLSLFFATADPHFPTNNYVSSKLIKYLSKECGINLTVCLGDLIEDSTVGHEQNLSRIQNAMNQLLIGTDRLLITQGNHDNGAGIVDGNGQIKFDRVVPDNEWIHHTSSKLLVTPKIIFDELGKAFYYDDMINKIRFISLDSFEDKSYTVNESGVITSSYLGSCTNRQVTWLRDVALNNIPSGYGVISFSHKPLYHPVIDNTEISRAEITVNSSSVITVLNNFKNNGGNFIAHFAGHQHHDFLDDLNNIPQVINLNDGTHWRTKSYWGDQADLVGDSPLKIRGTTNECAFDVVIINKTTKHVDLIRIGAGTDREFNY